VSSFFIDYFYSVFEKGANASCSSKYLSLHRHAIGLWSYLPGEKKRPLADGLAVGEWPRRSIPRRLYD